MGQMFTIMAVIAVMGFVIPVVNVVSPYATSYQTTPNQQLGSGYVLGQAGCTTTNSSGKFDCSSAANSASSPSFFGVSQFIFGNFLAALTFLVKMSISIFIPATYVLGWLGGPGTVSNPNAVGIGIASIVQVVVSIAYAYEYFFILSGRWIFP